MEPRRASNGELATIGGGGFLSAGGMGGPRRSIPTEAKKRETKARSNRFLKRFGINSGEEERMFRFEAVLAEISGGSVFFQEIRERRGGWGR
ncbi:MAG: hypothetical protein D6679_11200 [Candidatus Hydrogenedentota bacterium]|nr:MAG: hypothetical protein D6679_11200 [Candidatus Hydrogenedentota bacterium]